MDSILMKTYLANWVVDDVWFAIEFQASSYAEAEQHCAENDFELLGEKVGEEECPEEIEAMIEKTIYGRTEH